LSIDPQKSAAGRLGALAQQSRHSTYETTRSARAAADAKIVSGVDPDGTLSPEERLRRESAARKLYFRRLAMRSAEVRRRRREAAS
jgi:hypothetical protein